jgi:hypothetical protein
LAITDFNSIDGNVTELLEAMKIPYSIVSYDTPFSRSIGLSRAAQLVASLAANRSLENPRIFALDASMLLPEDFIERLRTRIICGQMVFAPVTYKLRETTWSPELPDAKTLEMKRRLDKGYWIHAGYGMIGFCLKDYLKVGGYDESWGYAWGAEDTELMDRFRMAGFGIYRSQESHYYHASMRNDSSPYYNQGRNSYEAPAVDDVRIIYQSVKSDMENDRDEDDDQLPPADLQKIDPNESLARWKHVQDVLHRTYGNDILKESSISRITAFFDPNKSEYLVVDMVNRHDQVIPPRVERVYIIENRLRPMLLATHEEDL